MDTRFFSCMRPPEGVQGQVGPDKRHRDRGGRSRYSPSFYSSHVALNPSLAQPNGEKPVFSKDVRRVLNKIRIEVKQASKCEFVRGSEDIRANPSLFDYKKSFHDFQRKAPNLMKILSIFVEKAEANKEKDAAFRMDRFVSVAVGTFSLMFLPYTPSYFA